MGPRPQHFKQEKQFFLECLKQFNHLFPDQPKLNSYGEGAVCFYCFDTCVSSTLNNNPLQATRDHGVPRHKGGKNITKIWCCSSCNQLKAGMQFSVFIKTIPEWMRLLCISP